MNQFVEPVAMTIDPDPDYGPLPEYDGTMVLRTAFPGVVRRAIAEAFRGGASVQALAVDHDCQPYDIEHVLRVTR
jgi:hypothetical protein